MGRLLLQRLEKTVEGRAVDIARDEDAVLHIERCKDRLIGVGIVCDAVAVLLALFAQMANFPCMLLLFC